MKASEIIQECNEIVRDYNDKLSKHDRHNTDSLSMIVSFKLNFMEINLENYKSTAYKKAAFKKYISAFAKLFKSIPRIPLEELSYPGHNEYDESIQHRFNYIMKKIITEYTHNS